MFINDLLGFAALFALRERRWHHVAWSVTDGIASMNAWILARAALTTTVVAVVAIAAATVVSMVTELPAWGWLSK